MQVFEGDAYCNIAYIPHKCNGDAAVLMESKFRRNVQPITRDASSILYNMPSLWQPITSDAYSNQRRCIFHWLRCKFHWLRQGMQMVVRSQCVAMILKLIRNVFAMILQLIRNVHLCQLPSSPTGLIQIHDFLWDLHLYTSI